MSNASPFELRLEMLKMAKDYLDQQYAISCDAARASWQASVEFAQKMNKEMPTFPNMPKMYGVDEISKMAETFNKFVSGAK